jgi:hypothetical protein
MEKNSSKHTHLSLLTTLKSAFTLADGRDSKDKGVKNPKTLLKEGSFLVLPYHRYRRPWQTNSVGRATMPAQMM